jgi:CheY-like chemotaxis protein
LLGKEPFMAKKPRPPASILCIDDDPQVLEINRAILESKGYKVLTAQDGAAGIALTRQHSIDAVVLDFHMPVMDGYQVAEMLTKEQPDLPVVIWSGCPDEIPESLKWYADALLHKGDGPNSLLSAVEKIVHAKDLRKPPAGIICRGGIGDRPRLPSGDLRLSNSRRHGRSR